MQQSGRTKLTGNKRHSYGLYLFVGRLMRDEW